MGKKNIISIRWNEKNLAFFKASGYIDKRSDKVLSKELSFNKFINSLTTLFFEKHRDEKFIRQAKAFLLQDLYDERILIDEKIKEISRR